MARFLLISTAGAYAVSVGNLRVEGVPKPLFLDIDYNPQPRFAWASDATAAQDSYHILVSKQPAVPAGDVWDSGIVASNASAQIPFASTNGGTAQPLTYDTDYYWSVCCTYEDASSACASGAFSVGLSASGWAQSAVWIGGFPQMRFNFTLGPTAVTRARMYVSGVGVYDAFLNGARLGAAAADTVSVGDMMLAPGWSTEPTVRQVAHAYDVTAALTAGENVIGVRTGMGKYGYIGVYCSEGEAACNAAVVYLSITQCPVSGSCINTSVTTSSAWMGSDSPIVFNHLFNGETYNASADQPGWAAPGFVPSPTHAWLPVSIITPNVSLLTGWDSPIRVMESRAPVKVNPGPGAPVVAGGQFVKSDASPDIWWVANGTSIKNFVTVCSPCASVDACNLFVVVAQSYIDGLSQGANFSCSMLPTGANSYVFDFARNMAGVCTLRVPTTASVAGNTLALVHGEITDASGAVDNTYGTSSPARSCGVNTGNCADQLDLYTCAGGIDEVYTPTFTFHGFRYVGLFGWPSTAPPPDASVLTCHVLYTDMEPAGGVTTNNTVLNAIQAAIVATQRSNLLSHPSDCPTREKRGWMGDAQASSDQALRNLNAGVMYENWMRSIMDTAVLGCSNPSTSASMSPLRPDTYICCGDVSSFGCQPGETPMNATGALPDVVPYELKPYGGWPGDTVWQVAAEVIPRALLQATGDVPALQRLYPAIALHVGFMATATASSPGGLISWGYYGDWLAPSGSSTLYVENVYYVRALLDAAMVAAATGHAADSVVFASTAALVSTSMVSKLFNAQTGVWDNGGPNAQAMALAVALGGNATANATATIAAAMLSGVVGADYHPQVGLASSRYILQGLTIANASAAFTMASIETSPSWGYMSTPDMPGTIWEEWGGDAHDSQGSKNHPMFTGGIGVWLYDDMLGMRASFAPGSVLDADVAAVRGCEASLSLGWSLTQHLGLSHAAALAVCDVVCTAREQGAAHAFLRSLLASSTHAAAVASAEGVLPPMQLRVSAAPHAEIVRAVRSASGWRRMGTDIIRVNWSYSPADAAVFTMRVVVPVSVHEARLGIPLGLLAEASSAGESITVSVSRAGDAPSALRIVRNAGSDATQWQSSCEAAAAAAPGWVSAVYVGTAADAQGEGRIVYASQTASELSVAASFLIVHVQRGGQYDVTVASKL